MRKTETCGAFSLRESLFAYIGSQYGGAPEYLWARFPDYAVFRHAENRKWFALVMDVPRRRLGLPGTGTVDLLNVKLTDPLLVDLLLRQPGYLRGYHIRSDSWVSVLLDGTVPFEDVCHMLDLGWQATAPGRSRKPRPDPSLQA